MPHRHLEKNWQVRVLLFAKQRGVYDACGERGLTPRGPPVIAASCCVTLSHFLGRRSRYRLRYFPLMRLYFSCYDIRQLTENPSLTQGDTPPPGLVPVVRNPVPSFCANYIYHTGLFSLLLCIRLHPPPRPACSPCVSGCFFEGDVCGCQRGGASLFHQLPQIGCYLISVRLGFQYHACLSN